MISPVSPNSQMEPVEIEPGLVAHKCPKSGGYWISENCYWRWFSKQPERLKRLPDSEGHDVQEEAGQPVRLCPETGRIMTRYRVGEGFSFRIDRSPNGGVWLDAGEWEALKSRNFHDELLFIFTNSWQQKIVKEDQARALRDQVRERLGTNNYARLVEFKKWMVLQKERQTIIAFLQDPDL